MKLRGFLFLLATFFLTGCTFPGRKEEPNLIAQAAPQEQKLFDKPMHAAFLFELNGKEVWVDSPEFQFVSDRAYLAPQAKNVVFFRASDVTWGEFFSSIQVKIEGNCVTIGDEQTCAKDGEKLSVVFNSESLPYDANWKMNSGDRLFASIGKDAPSRTQLSQVPDPWAAGE